MRKPPSKAILLGLALPVLVACSTIQQQYCLKKHEASRTYIDNAMFIKADKLYDECGTLDGVKKTLKSKEYWTDAEINEAVYRLKKTHDLL